jgi:hypothetical protein
MIRYGSNTLFCLPLFFLLLLAGVITGHGAYAGGNSDIIWDGSLPPQGVSFYWYEPSFYSGFAPRTQDSTRTHILLSRGNQMRVTLVLGSEEQDSYAEDLALRHTIYQELIDKGIIQLSVNMAYERFAEALEQNGVRELAASRDSSDPAVYRRRSVELMTALNPGRVFPIHMELKQTLSSWHRYLQNVKEQGLNGEAALLDAANAILPGRVNLYQLTPEQLMLLEESATLVWEGKGAEDQVFIDRASAFLQAATLGHYPANNGFIDTVEFTSIIPVGTLQAMVRYKQWKLSSFGVTGVWHLIPREEGRGQLGMVDYLSPNPGYGFIPLLQYQHAGGVYYNALHNAGVRTQLNTAHFVPEEWKHVAGERNPKKIYQNLWIVSRGPASHGCTRLPSGYMSELRHMLPASSETLTEVATYRNLPQCYELFDIDGNGSREVMGIQYYLAFAGKGHTPTNAYAQNNRKDFYDWLYGDNVTYNSDGSAIIKEVQTCRFVGKKAEESGLFRDQPLHEAEYYPEEIQFYRLKPVDFKSPRGMIFNRELRRLGVGVEIEMDNLFLE